MEHCKRAVGSDDVHLSDRCSRLCSFLLAFRVINIRLSISLVPSYTIRNSWITFHHFIFRELFFVIISSWLTSKNAGRIILRNSSDVLLYLSSSDVIITSDYLGELFTVKISWALHQNISRRINFAILAF